MAWGIPSKDNQVVVNIEAPETPHEWRILDVRCGSSYALDKYIPKLESDGWEFVRKHGAYATFKRLDVCTSRQRGIERWRRWTTPLGPIATARRTSACDGCENSTERGCSIERNRASGAKDDCYDSVSVNTRWL